MAKQKLKHMTADGKVHTRTTARTYTHVIVVDSDPGSKIGPDGRYIFEPCQPYVRNWVGRPDLIAGAMSDAARYGRSPANCRAEPINNGVRT